MVNAPVTNIFNEYLLKNFIEGDFSNCTYILGSNEVEAFFFIPTISFNSI